MLEYGNHCFELGLLQDRLWTQQAHGRSQNVKLLWMWSEMSLPSSVVMFQHTVPEPSIWRPLEIPFSTVFEVEVRLMKSSFLLDMRVEAPVSMHIG